MIGSVSPVSSSSFDFSAFDPAAAVEQQLFSGVQYPYSAQTAPSVTNESQLLTDTFGAPASANDLLGSYSSLFSGLGSSSPTDPMAEILAGYESSQTGLPLGSPSLDSVLANYEAYQATPQNAVSNLFQVA